MNNIYKIKNWVFIMRKFVLVFLLFLLILPSVFSDDNVIDVDNSEEALEKGDYIISFMRTFLGIGFFLSALYSSMVWAFSGGDLEKIERAKRNLTLAVLGFLISFVLPEFIEFGFTSARESAIGLIGS